jgi:hypothetical protein
MILHDATSLYSETWVRDERSQLRTSAGNKLQCGCYFMFPHDFQPAPRAALLENRTDMELGCTFADTELRGNLFICETLQNEPEDFALPTRELQGRVCAEVVFRKTLGDVLIDVPVEHLHGTSHSF